jgi:large subunit ribosomal protein L23
MDHTHVIIRPLVTEKTTHQQSTRNVYTFEVNREANKHQIAQAVEHLYNVKVSAVRTINRKGKPRRTRYRMTHTGDWKRAVVALAGEGRIELF